ncbi:MAG: hypothetical protein PCFJNLEI_01312 [Verrucomicrobiae bacterium]|nr:hypothetical protein [Verrucomicrobiae bacterium]
MVKSLTATASRLLVLLAMTLPSCNKPARTEGGIPVYITPYYNSAGLQIAVGKHSAGLAEGKTMPALKTIYPQSVFVDEKQWPALNEQINAGMTQFIEYLNNNVAAIKRLRQQAGIEGKY